MIRVKVYFEDGNTLVTRINCTFEEAKHYYIGMPFNMGTVDDYIIKCTHIEQLKL